MNLVSFHRKSVIYLFLSFWTKNIKTLHYFLHIDHFRNTCLLFSDTSPSPLLLRREARPDLQEAVEWPAAGAADLSQSAGGSARQPQCAATARHAGLSNRRLSAGGPVAYTRHPVGARQRRDWRWLPPRSRHQIVCTA